MDSIKIRRLGWVGHIVRMEDECIPKKKILNGKFHNKRAVGKTKNKMGGRLLDGHITDPRIKRMEVSSEEGQGPEEAAVPSVGG